MNSSFQAIATAFKGPQPVLTHAQHVTRLYRRALKLSLSWAIDRDLWHEKATEIRSEFDANKSLSPNDGLTKRLVREADERLEHYTHPELYVLPWMPGGSKFMRNPPQPIESLFDGDVPDDVELSPAKAVNVDMTPMPAKKHVLVDFSSKEY